MNEILNNLFEKLNQHQTINLFPTENRLSPKALQLLSSDLVNRYPGAEGPDFFYGDTYSLSSLYSACQNLTANYFGAKYAYVNYLSGLHAMRTIVSAILKKGDRLLIMDPMGGGHYATASICEQMDLVHDYVPFDSELCTVDFSALEKKKSFKPKMIYLDWSTIIRLSDVNTIREIFGPEIVICLDASHLLGLMPVLDNKIGLIAGASTVSGSTHKTFPGPQKAVLVTNNADIAEIIGQSMSISVSSAHSNSIAALSQTLSEMNSQKEVYANDVISNAKYLGEYLYDKGFDVAGKDFGFSETHQIWIHPKEHQLSKNWGKRLVSCGIRNTVVNLPDRRIPGLRIGTQEVTRMGMGKVEMKKIAEIFYRCFMSNASENDLRAEVAALSTNFNTVNYTREI